MRLFHLLLLFGLVFLASCSAGFQQAVSYDAKSLTTIAMPDDTYRVFEHPDKTRIMLTTSLSKSASQGFASGLTLGIVRVETVEQKFEAAARAHLDRTERSHCKILRGYELIRNQYEFQIECIVENSAAVKLSS